MSFDDYDSGRYWLKKPPAPKWHGFGQGLQDKFVAFVKKQRRENLLMAPRQWQTELELKQLTLADAQETLRVRRNNVAKTAAEVASLTEVIKNLPTDEMIAEEFRLLEETEYVIGTRVDMYGRIYVQVRVTAERENVLYDVGDFEIGLFYKDGCTVGTYPVNLIRVPANVNVYWALRDFRADRDPYNDRMWIGRIILPGIYLRQGKLRELVGGIHEKLATAGRRPAYEDSFPHAEPVEPVWDGFTVNPVKAYRRSLASLKDTSLETELATKKRELQENERVVERRLQTIREYQTEIRRVRAELAKAVRATELIVVEIDEADARAQIDKIATLPGVMGIKFDADGVPVIHIRTSHVYRGRRYDMGDYEVSLTTAGRNEEESVVKVRSTRMSPDALYRHNGGTRDEWFCFGSRRAELAGLLAAQEYAQFVHLLIHSMNGVNAHSRDEYTLSGYFKEIPLEAVWQPARRPTRPRRRSIGRLVLSAQGLD